MSRLSDCLGKVASHLQKGKQANPLTKTITERMERDVQRLTEKKMGEGLKEPEAHLAAAKEIVGKHLETTKGHLEDARKNQKLQADYEQPPVRTEMFVEKPEPKSAPPEPAKVSNAPEAKETTKETVSDDRPRSSRVPEQYTAKELGLPEVMQESHKAKIARALYENKPVHAGEAKRFGLEIPEHYKVGSDDIARPQGESKEPKLSLSSEPSPEPSKKVSQLNVSRAIERLRNTPLGRKLLRTAHIVPDWERTVSHPANKDRNFSGKEINVIKQAQGFYDPETGKTFVIRDNIVLKPGETPEQAVVRVLMHERIGHDGMAWMRANDPEFEKLYHDIAKDIPKSELDEIAQRYGYDKVNDRDRIIGEWFAQNVERLSPEKLPDPRSLLGRMWQAVKDFINRLTGKQTATDQMVRDLAAAIAHSDEALEPRTGSGEVEPMPTRAVREGSVVTPQEDRAYMDAVEKGDTETTQKMVDEAAKKVGYEHVVFHGTKGEPFNEFKKTEGPNAWYGEGVYVTRSPEGAKWYSGKEGNIINGYAKAEKTYHLTSNDQMDSVSAKKLTDRLKSEGYDSIEVTGKDPSSNELILFDPSQIKSADPITRDANGKVIPLSERFNPKSNDIRFSRGPSDIEASIPQVLKDAGTFIKDKAGDALDMIKEGQKVKKFTPFRKAIGKFGSTLQQASLAGRDFQREFKKAVPDKLTRRAIGAYIEADGNTQVLDQQAQLSTGEAKAKYEKAQKLTPEEKQWADKVSQTYDDLGQQAIASGILDAGSLKQNYLTKIWKQSLSPAKQKQFAGFATKLASTFKFGKKSTWNNFFQGEQAGFTPHTDDPMELLPIYQMEMAKSIGTRNLAKDLLSLKAQDGAPLAVPIGGSIDTGTVNPGDPSLITNRVPAKQNAAGEDVDYRRLDNPALKKWKWVDKTPAGDDVLMNGELAVHPEIYSHMKNMLGRSAIKEWYESPSTTLGQSVAKKAVKIADVLNSGVKQSMLSFSPFHIVQEATHAVGHKVSPFSFEKIDPSNPAHQDAMAHGLQLAGDQTSMDQWMEGASGKGWMDKIPGIGKLNQAIGDFTFHDYIPGLKLKTYEAALGRNMDRFKDDISSGKLTKDDVKALTADQVNNAYGHLDYKAMGSNPTIEHLLRLTLLAPDFLRARLGFTKQAIQGLTSKTGREQLNAMAVLAGTFYTGARILNALINDGDTKAKEAPFGVMVGDRVYTMRSVPEDIYKALTSPRQFVSGRLSPLTTRTAMEALTGRDYRGQLISSGDTAINAFLQAVPLSARELPWIKDLTTTTSQNPISPWEQFMSTLGVHANRYSPISATYRNLNDWEKSQGKPDKGIQPVSRYAQLRYALEDNNPEKAKDEWDALVKKEHDQNPKVPLSQLKEKLAKGFHSSEMRGFADNAQEEREFYRSLDPDQKAQFKEATKLKSSIWKRFRSVTGHGKELSSEAKDRLSS